jgi:hypothetical protein
MAWAHTRDPELLQAWKAIQVERQLLPGGLNDEQAIKLFLSQPPPNTAHHLPGPFDAKVLPASPERDEGIAMIIERAGGVTSSQPQEPIELELEPTPLEPVLLEPPPGQGAAAGGAGDSPSTPSSQGQPGAAPRNP